MKIFCELCETEMNSSALGWICPKCWAFRDMKGITRPHVEKPFMPPQTNGDYIRSMTDNLQLAHTLIDFVYKLFEDGEPSAEFIADWLRQPKEQQP